MLFLKVALQVAAVIAAVAVAMLDYVVVKESKSYNPIRISLFVILGVMILGTIVTVIFDDKEKQKETQQLYTRIKDLEGQIQETKASITGGDSYCYVYLQPDISGNSARLSIHNDTDNIMRGVSFRMWDPADYSKPSTTPPTLESMLSRSLQKDIGDIPPHVAQIIGTIPFAIVEKKNFKVKIIANNGHFTEDLQLRFINGDWAIAYRINKENRDGSLQLIKEESNSNFPKTQDQEIIWDKP